MSEIQKTVPENITTPPLDRSQAIHTMLCLRWPDYESPDKVLDTATDQRLAMEAVQAGNDYIPNRRRTIQEEWDTNPYLLRADDAETDAKKARQLATILAKGPLASCEPLVATAFQKNVSEATRVLETAFADQNTSDSYTEIATFDTKAGMSLQSLRFLFAGVAGVLGALPHEEAYAEYDTQLFPGVYETHTTKRNGISNSYLIKSHDVLEIPEDDYVELESPAILTITAIPGVRVEFTLNFNSDQLNHKFTSDSTTSMQPHISRGISVRIDREPNSPHGYSVDFGRDKRDEDDFVRSADELGESLQQLRPEGSHFTDNFNSVNEAAFDEFVAGVADFLRADAAMDALDKRYHATQALNASRDEQPFIYQEALSSHDKLRFHS